MSQNTERIIMGYEGEVALKGLNRRSFEDAIARNIRKKIAAFGEFNVSCSQSTFYVKPSGDADVDAAYRAVQNTFGLANVAQAYVVKRDFEEISRRAVTLFADRLKAAATFKVQAKRADKDFPMDSMKIGRELGGVILDSFPHLRVKMDEPDVVVFVEIRDGLAFLHTGKQPAAGGMPVGTSGRAMLLLSGGIDSPVAAYLAAKRGLQLSAVHFASPPYTSERALKKVTDLGGILTDYIGPLPFHNVSFSEIGEALRAGAPEPLHTIIMRRSMARIANILAAKEGCEALVTGESLAQVASQTLKAINCTDLSSQLPILRPVLCFDKVEITAVARRIGTFETSILPYEDCCTIFTPPHPKTRPSPEEVELAEQAIPLAELEQKAAASAQFSMIRGMGASK